MFRPLSLYLGSLSIIYLDSSSRHNKESKASRDTKSNINFERRKMSEEMKITSLILNHVPKQKKDNQIGTIGISSREMKTRRYKGTSKP